MSFVEVYRTKLAEKDFTQYNLPFTTEELIGKLPEYLPYSEYHGDFTLENILYNTQKNDFVLIDPLTTVYSSFVFDLAKLRQDLQCKWFIRNDSVYLDSKLQSIIDGLQDYPHFNNDYILILMLMRVLPYTRNDTDEKFLIDEIKKLWK
jgi:Ser/Thr protein kinase RdoA (MazF antagonist)